MTMRPDVLIIGGGVIGLTTAYFLAREGVPVEVLDKGDFGQEASWAGAGILPPANVQQARTALEHLRAHSAARFPTLSAELRDRTGIDNGYLRCGGLEFIENTGQTVADEWRSKGIALEQLDSKHVHQLEPALRSELSAAYYLPDMAQVRNPRHLKALLAGCQFLGVRLRPGCSAYEFEMQGKRITGVRTERGLIEGGQFLLAAGAWSDGLLQSIGWRPGIRPVRGQIVLINSGVPLFRRILLCGRRYLVPRPDGRVLVGSTEEDAGFDKRTTTGAVGDLLALARDLVPSLAGAHLERCWAGLRPGTPDELPFLGPVPGFENLFIAAGHFRAGIQLSPATGIAMTALILGQPSPVPLDAFRLERTVRS